MPKAPNDREFLEFLLNCSALSMDNFLLSEWTRHSQLKRRLDVILGEMEEIRSRILTACLFRKFGPEILEWVSSTPQIEPHKAEIQSVKLPKKA